LQLPIQSAVLIETDDVVVHYDWFMMIGYSWYRCSSRYSYTIWSVQWKKWPIWNDRFGHYPYLAKSLDKWGCVNSFI